MYRLFNHVISCSRTYLLVLIASVLSFSSGSLAIAEDSSSKSSSPISQSFGVQVPQTYAVVYVSFQNRNRFSWGEHDQECPGLGGICWHSCPFGNWGVDSNFFYRVDLDQFKGWKLMDESYEWNSCTSGNWEAPNALWYNADNYTHQQSTQGVGTYAGTTYCWVIPTLQVDKGCSYLNGKTLTFTGSYMRVWELDPFDDDEEIKKLIYPNLQRIISNCTVDGCPSQSSTWKGVSGYSPTTGGQVIDAQIRFVIEACDLADASQCT